MLILEFIISVSVFGTGDLPNDRHKGSSVPALASRMGSVIIPAHTRAEGGGSEQPEIRRAAGGFTRRRKRHEAQ